MTLRPCLTCGAPCAGSYCNQHTPAAWAGSDRRSTLPKDWSRRVSRILRRDHHRCVLCGSGDRPEVDHAGDRNDHRDHMLRTLCHDCHVEHTAQQSLAARLK